MTNPPLRVGLLLDTYQVPVWQEVMFRQIVESGYAEIVFVVLNDLVEPEADDSWTSRLLRDPGRIPSMIVTKGLTFLYDKVIDRKTRLPDANEITDVECLLEGVPTLRVKPDRKTYSDYFRSNDIDVIRSQRLDILIRSGFGILRGDILHAARFGVWSYHHGDNRVNRGGPPGYWESMEGWPVTGSVLQILNEDLDNGTILYRSLSRTRPFSVRDNRSNYYWKSLSFMTRAMKELHETGEEDFFDRVEDDNRHPAIYSRRLYRSPTTRELAGLIVRKLIDKVLLVWEGIRYFNQWVLLYHLSPELSSSLWRYEKIMPPKDRYWADPHVIHRDGRYHIFVEEYLFGSDKGRISVISMDESGSYGDSRVVLDPPYHLSYPFVFESGDDLYLIPESIENRTIELYRCVSFPLQWELVTNLMEDVAAVDTTLVKRDGRWWLFTNMVSRPGCSADDELFLFSSEELLSRDWVPHPMNPIVSDCTRARPAGKLFTVDGRLYRPSQNCGTRYGYGFNFSEVTTLTRTRYEEVLVSRAKPDWDDEILGTHTFSRVGQLNMIDGLHRRRRW